MESFGYIIKVDNGYYALDLKSEHPNAAYWRIVNDKKAALIMSLSYAENTINVIKSYLPTAKIIGVDYEQN